MKKSILFVLPLFAMTIVGCGSKKVLPSGGKEANLQDTIGKFETALNYSATRDAIGLKLTNGTIKIDETMNQITMHYDPVTDQYRHKLFNITETASLEKLNLNVGLKNLGKIGLKNIKGSAKASGQLKLTFKGEGMENVDQIEQYIGNINEKLEANAYLDDGLLYFDFNDGLKNTINSIAKASGSGKDIVEGNKYYVDPGFANLPDISLNQMLAILLSQVDISQQIIDNLPSFVTNFITAYSYSDTKYAVYANVDVNKINDLISTLAGIPYPILDNQDKAQAEAIIIFDTQKGISEVKLKADADGGITLQEYINLAMGGQNYYGLTDEELKLPYISVKSNIYLDINFLYGNSVSVTEIKNKDGYEPMSQGGGSVKPQPEPSRIVDYDTFVAEAKNRPTAPEVKRLVADLEQNGQIIHYDSSVDTDQGLGQMVMSTNIDSFIETGIDPNANYQFYVGGTGFEVEIYGDSLSGVSMFDVYGNLVYYHIYQELEGYTMNLTIEATWWYY